MWIMSLPRVAADAVPHPVDPVKIAPWMIEMQTAWGALERLGPIARMSATRPRWDLPPPAKLGSHPAAWSSSLASMTSKIAPRGAISTETATSGKTSIRKT
jgi:hypothetical protein